MTRPTSSSESPPGATRDAPTGRSRRKGVRERARIGGAERPKRSPRALAISVLAHVVVAVVVAQLLTFGHGLSSFLNFGKDADKQERVTYVATKPRPTKAQPATPATKPAAQPQTELTVPGATTGGNAELPSAPPVVARADTGSGGAIGGTGNGVGAVDPNLKGVAPSYGDKRVWQGPVGNGVAPGRDGVERLDSIIGYAITSARDSLDSLARAQGKYGKAPGDWTTKDKNGNKWGWDNAGIRLGKVVIPNALLSLLPLNAQVGMSGNYTAMERERRLSLSRADILRMSDRTLGDADFKKLATELRDRRERERRDRLRAPSASVAPVAPSPQPPKDDDPKGNSPN
ncbi:MAG: hypothetical protein IPP90_16120 [Gemmatimonadaceae bacterium]|nr:hypothetical protein [Gemmatimonadaceae bacterium]